MWPLWVAGVWLTDLSLFETYVFATPLLSMALPAMFGGGSMNNLALSFGAPRRLCFWGWQLTSILIAVLCLAMTWLTFALTDGKMVERNSIAWDWGGMSLLFAGCVFALQGSILSQTMEKGWRRFADRDRSLDAELCAFDGGADLYSAER